MVPQTDYRCYDCGEVWFGDAYQPGAKPVVCPKADQHDNVLTKEAAVQMLDKSKGRWFTIEFTKRTTGEKRTMTCRTGVKKHLKGGARAYDPKELGLMIVWEAKSSAYKSIPTDAITAIRYGGKHYEVRP
jgi:hypothetical protein